MFKSKLLYKIIGILVFLIVSFILSMTIVNFPNIDKSIQTLEEKNAKETLDRVVGIAQNSAQNLENFKKRALKNYKQDLKNMTEIASSILNDYYTQYKEGKLTQGEAKKIAYEKIIKLRYGDYGYFFIVDDNYLVLSHINKDLLGKDFSKVKDIQGKYFIKEMIDKTRKDKESYTSYWWKKPNGNISEKLSYTKAFEPWKAYIGTGLYIDDIQKEMDTQKAKLIKDLREIMIHTKIGKTGYIYVFNKEGEMIIHPNNNIEGINFRNLKNPLTSNMIYDDLVKASTTTKILRYKWNSPSDKGNYIYNKTSWIEFVPSLQWYIGSSAYTDEFKETSRALIKNIIRFGILILIITIIISILLFKRLLSPLDRLSQTANRIANGDYHARANITSKDEIGDLANNFNAMAKTVEDYIKNLDRKVQEKTKELNNINSTLEEKIEEEVEKNRLQDKQLIQQSRMAQMGEMLSMIAHQWRQPLAAISATSASIELKATLNKLDNDTAIQKAQNISNFSQHLSKTIDDFRDFFKQNKQNSEVTYDDIIRSVLDIIEVSLTNKNIQLLQELNCHESFSTYPNELRQVVLNLIKNAEDALLGRAVKDPTIKIITYTKEDQYILTISDNAKGIPEKIIDKIFDPYFSTKEAKDGTGLGLYMSKTIIEKHCGGNLSVSNDKDGAAFKIVLKVNSL